MYGQEFVRDVRIAFEQKDERYLRELAGKIAARAAAEHDEDLARLAVIAYALSKLLGKAHFVQSPNWPRYRHAILSALRDAERGYERHIIQRVEQTIRRIDQQDGHFVKNIVDKARAKMAAVAYSTGVSPGIAAKLFGADLADLLSYIGNMKVHEEHETHIGILERVEALRRLAE